MNIVLTVVTCLAAAAAVGASVPLSFASEFNPFLPVQPLDDENVGSPNIHTAFIEQRVDNFDTNNHATYQQRYLQYGRYHQPGGPLLVLLGGFLAVSEQRLASSLPYGLARDLGGCVFYLEHRYYGRSHPVA